MSIGNPILDAKRPPHRTIGAWLSVGNTFVAEALAKQRFDFIAIDLQHGTVGWDMLGPVIQAIELGGSCAIVRVPWNFPPYIMRALDLGAVGVIVPMISTAEEAHRAAQAVRYPPQGNRSFGPCRSYYSMDAKPVEPACLVMIETREGLENIAEIASTPGIDGMFLGPVDLAIDLGLAPSALPHPAVSDAIDRMISVCDDAGIVPGSASLGTQNAEDLLGRGVRFVALSSDLGYLGRGIQQDAELLKRWKGAT